MQDDLQSIIEELEKDDSLTIHVHPHRVCVRLNLNSADRVVPTTFQSKVDVHPYSTVEGVAKNPADGLKQAVGQLWEDVGGMDDHTPLENPDEVIPKPDKPIPKPDAPKPKPEREDHVESEVDSSATGLGPDGLRGVRDD